MIIMPRKPSRRYRLVFVITGGLFVAYISICMFFMVHNAHWLISDEAIVISHTGMGRPFSFLGLDGMIESYGRFYPFAYTLYNVLLLFYDSYIPVAAHYILQAIALLLFALSFFALFLLILKEDISGWKYGSVLCLVMVCVARVFPVFITCFTGVWIVFMCIPLFLLTLCKFDVTEHWGWGISALIVVNYVIYCYETVFVISLSIGACSLIFNYRNLSLNKRVFNWLLIASGLLFLVLYAIFVLPNATEYYHHQTDSFWSNAFQMFIAHKIYWIALAVLLIRVTLLVGHKSRYALYDSILLASFAYFIGAAVLKLDYTYYYNIGELVALVSIVFFLNDWIGSRWLCVVALLLAVFYCRKMPSQIIHNQESRVNTFKSVSVLAEYCKQGDLLYWYAPKYNDPSAFLVEERGTQRIRLEVYLSWLLQNEVLIVERDKFSRDDSGIWLFPRENRSLFPKDDTENDLLNLVFNAGNIKGYIIEE